MIHDSARMDVPIDQGRTRGRRLGWLLALTAALAVAAIALYPTWSRWASAERSIDAAKLRYAVVTRGDLERDVAVQGKVVAANHPKLYSPQRGIAALQVRSGQVIEAGELLVAVASPELESRLEQERSAALSLSSELTRARIEAKRAGLRNQQQVELLRVKLGAAERALARAERLGEEGLMNQFDHEAAKDAVAVAQLELAHARQTATLAAETATAELEDRQLRVERQQLVVGELERQVADLAVRAPFAGMVASIEIADREAVERNQALLTVVDLTSFEVEVAIPETYADDVAPGTPAVVRWDGQDFAGELTRVSPEVTASQVEATVAFVGPQPRGLRQSQRLSTRLILDARRDVLKVARGPFLEAGGGHFVYLVQDGLATKRSITVGAASVAEVEIASGLHEGDRIVVSDTNKLEGAESVLLRD